MPLNPALLQTRLTRAYSRPPRKLVDVVSKLADAYEEYAAQAVVGPPAPTVAPVFTGAEKARFKAVLQAYFTTPRLGTPRRAAQAWSDAVAAFWLGTPSTVLFPGSIALAYIPAPLTSCLVPVFSVLHFSPLSAGSSQSPCLDVATRTVAVTFPGPVVGTLI